MSFLDKSIVKPLATAAFIAAGEKFVFGNNDLKSVAMYSAAVGASSVAASLIAPHVTPDLGLNMGSMVSGKVVEERIVELTFGVGSAWAVNKFVLKNNFDFKSPDTLKRIGVLVAAEVAGEYASDFLSNQKLNYFE